MRKIIQFAVLFILWLLLTWSLDWQDIAVGLIFSLITVLLLSDIFLQKVTRLVNPIRIFWFIIYIPCLLWEIIKANFDVAYRVLHPALPIRPGIVKVKTTLKTDMGQTFLANSITLTPGTLTVDIIDDYLYVHWINVKTDDPEKQTKIIVDRFEKIIRRIFE
ncbi:Na+/H+ antiporter subunit E [bacterium]|nr:Na+/H+ antiporter subunit E [bacterium]